MLRALIIDDEMYVRRKMHSIVDWRAYGIALVGEAASGPDALALLAQRQVDIIFTDLQMPGLHGIPFLRAVRERYPSIRIVVLTMHQDFALIQQAMRLGVDDYIAKAEITDGNFGGMLTEILGRIQSLPGLERVYADDAYCLYFPNPQPAEAQTAARRLSEHFFFREPDEAIPADAVAIHVQGLHGENYRQLRDLLSDYVDRALFYEYHPGVALYRLDAGTAAPRDAHAEMDAKALEALTTLKSLLSSAHWLLRQKTYAQVIRLVPALGLTRDALVAFFFHPFLRCAEYLNVPADYYFEKTAGIRWWTDWIAWFASLRDQLTGFMSREDTAAHAIEKAVLYIGAHYQEEIPLQTILRVAALSKSHFSSLFKERMGMTFVDYLKCLRMEHAKAYLQETDWPVAQVARQVGYADERYFRRVFLELEGVSPARYRAVAAGDKG